MAHLFKCILLAVPFLVYLSKPIWHQCAEKNSHQQTEKNDSLSFESSAQECELCDLQLSSFHTSDEPLFLIETEFQFEKQQHFFYLSFTNDSVNSSFNKGPPIQV